MLAGHEPDIGAAAGISNRQTPPAPWGKPRAPTLSRCRVCPPADVAVRGRTSIRCASRSLVPVTESQRCAGPRKTPGCSCAFGQQKTPSSGGKGVWGFRLSLGRGLVFRGSLACTIPPPGESSYWLSILSRSARAERLGPCSLVCFRSGAATVNSWPA